MSRTSNVAPKRPSIAQQRRSAATSLLSPLVLLVFTWGSQVNAAVPRYDKREVTVQPIKQAQAKAPGEAERRGPGLEAEAFRRAVEAKVGRLTDDMIATLIRLVKVTPKDDPERPDYLFRLAEHYRDKKVEYSFKARELDEKIFTAPEAQKGRLKAQQERFEKAERDWMYNAIKLYLRIADTPEYARYKRMDEVLYNLADMLNQAKRQDRARVFFAELIRNYPQSKYIPDAYLSFAEHFFNEGRVEDALRRYEQVARYKDTPLYGYAVYKQAWCWLNLKDPRRALELFVQVIKEGNRYSGSKKSKIILIREAKKDSVRAYALVGTPDRAWPFFRRIGGDYAMTMLERLGQIYYDQGKNLEAIEVYKQLMSLEPRSPKLCDWQYAVLNATRSGKEKPDHVVEAKRMAAVYQASRSRTDIRKAALTECRDNAAGTLRELATTWHREAQKTANDDTYSLAQYMYREYLDTFPQEKDAYLMAFYYAELLFKLQRWEEAADAYTRVVQMKGDGKFLQEAAYAAVISWKNALNVEEEMKDTETVEGAEKLKPRPISEKHNKMIAAFDTYLKYVPRAAKERPTILYRKARIYYEHNQFDKAKTLFASVVLEHPEDQLAVFSANLLLDCLNALKSYDELLDWLGRLKGMPALYQGELKEQIDKLYRQFERIKLEQAQKSGRYRECGEGYASLASQNPDDPKWPELAYNAALCYEAAKLIGPAITIRKQLIKVAKDHPLAQKAMYMIGANYHGLAWYSRAASWYERFAKAFPGEQEAPEAMQNAIVFRLGRAEQDKAAEDIRFFAKTYGNRPKYAPKTAQVVFSLGTLFEQRNDLDSMIKHYENYLKTWGRYGGTDRQIVANVRIGRALWRQSCPGRSVNGACIKIERVQSKREVKRSRRRKDKIELRKQCGPDTKNRITVVKRNPAKARAAMARFKAALALGRRGGRSVKGEDPEEIARREQELQSALAEAAFHEAEALFEAMLEVEFPQNLDFSEQNKARLKDSKRRFTRYLDVKGKKMNQAREAYQDVIKLRVPHWAIAAAARIGQLFQNFAGALYTAPVPRPNVPGQLRTRDEREEFMMAFTDAYCDTLEDKARPLEEKAEEGLAACLTRSTELSWYNEWSSLCESELNQINAVKWPIAAEIRAEPGYLSMRAIRAPVITEVN